MKQVQINKGENIATVTLNILFYDIESVLETARVFEDVAWVYIDSDSDKKVMIDITPKESSVSAETLAFEFCNHVLSAIKNLKFSL